uniref:Delta-8 fatty acid desaturase n=1 Tax=Euglena gracilis TaxID=3039 RepID=D3YQ69_EUGGR|nr:delta-8 fatty acid desaturase [Euglena gracilis]
MKSKRQALPLTIDGTTYDVSAWVNFHPGGAEIIENYQGRDATDAFMVMHSQEAFDKLKRMPKINPSSELPPQAAVNEAQEDFRKLREELIATGMFDASPLWYSYKISTTLGLGVLGYFLMVQYQMYFIGAVLLGMHYQQMGWLSHDICHHQTFKNRNWNNLVGLVSGNGPQGFSVTWWKDRHNAHHSATNVQGHDPDIDNLPLLAWSEDDVTRASPISRKLIQFQQYYFLVICILLRFIWCFQSVLTVRSLKDRDNQFYRSQYKKEAIGLALHWTLKALFHLFFMPSILTSLLVFFVSELVGGFGIAIVVFMNHYPLEKIGDSVWDGHGFSVGQIHETMNIRRGIITDWFFGGLNYQIEHHLWPTLPRHNLTAVSYQVEQLCQKHNLPYRNPLPHEGLVILLRYLAVFARMAEKQPAGKAL